MDIRDFQDRSNSWHSRKHPGISIRDQCEKVIEEAVESLEAHSILNALGESGAPYEFLGKAIGNVSHEIGDVIIAAINLATISGIDVQTILIQRMEELEKG